MVATENSFSDLGILNQEELLHKLLNIHAELSLREKANKNFLRTLCSLSVETRIWWILFEAGGAQGFTDIIRVAGCSRTKLSNVLWELQEVGLVRVVDKRYQALSPT